MPIRSTTQHTHCYVSRRGVIVPAVTPCDPVQVAGTATVPPLRRPSCGTGKQGTATVPSHRQGGSRAPRFHCDFFLSFFLSLASEFRTDKISGGELSSHAHVAIRVTFSLTFSEIALLISLAAASETTTPPPKQSPSSAAWLGRLANQARDRQTAQLATKTKETHTNHIHMTTWPWLNPKCCCCY